MSALPGEDVTIPCPDVGNEEGAALRLTTSGEVFLDAYNEGGCCGTSVDLAKLFRWMRVEHPSVFANLLDDTKE